MEYNEPLPESGSAKENNLFPQPVRPGLLSVLCVLTFIGSGLSALAYLSVWIGFDTMRDMVFLSGLYDDVFDMMPELRTNMETMFSISRAYYLLAGLFYVVSVIGAVLMWQLRRKGFHIYTIAQCVLILVSMLMLPGTGVPYSALVWTGIFVALYAVHLRYMQK